MLAETKLFAAIQDRITPTIEDYLEAILRIQDERGVVRIKEISQALGVTYPSTSGIIKKMESMGLVEHERYGYVRLTDNGRQVGALIARREEVLFRFFREILKLDEEVSRADACRVEHAISQQTAERLVKFIQFVIECPHNTQVGSQICFPKDFFADSPAAAPTVKGQQPPPEKKNRPRAGRRG